MQHRLPTPTGPTGPSRRIGSTGVTTSGGLHLPPVGFGTYKLTGKHGADVMAAALDAGYRLLDSASSYENEATVGAAIRRSGVSRSEIVVTSKLAGRYHAFEAASDAVERSVLRTGLDHIDLFLIHWPNPHRGQFVEAWRALIDAKDRGLVRHIGVCNFTAEHIDRLISETGVVPEVNQVEVHPYFNQLDLIAHHRNHNIITMGWGPLGRGGTLLLEPTVQATAAAHAASPAQVVLAWHLAQGVVPIPKATAPARQRENLDVFTVALTEPDLAALASLNDPDGRTGGQDPDAFEEL